MQQDLKNISNKIADHHFSFCIQITISWNKGCWVVAQTWTWLLTVWNMPWHLFIPALDTQLAGMLNFSSSLYLIYLHQWQTTYWLDLGPNQPRQSKENWLVALEMKKIKIWNWLLVSQQSLCIIYTFCNNKLSYLNPFIWHHQRTNRFLFQISKAYTFRWWIFTILTIFWW